MSNSIIPKEPDLNLAYKRRIITDSTTITDKLDIHKVRGVLRNLCVLFVYGRGWN